MAAAATGGAEAAARYLFVYGSLRPDDNSGQSWTTSFVEDFTFSKKARVRGAKMFRDTYASVTLDGEKEEFVHGWVLGFAEHDEAKWGNKLNEADMIEGYNAKDPPSGLYERGVITAVLEDGGSVQAYIYHRPRCNRATRIPSGNWLDRPQG